MSCNKMNQNDAAQAIARRRAASATRPEDGRTAREAEAQGDAHAMHQAARSVMHPEHHEPEWRFYHSAMHG